MARTREVFPTDEVPHLFAAGAVATARNPHGNLHFSGPDIWSYSTRIGSIYPTAARRGVAPGRVLLLSARRYSMTTGRQLDAIRRAFVGHGLCVEVPELGGGHGGAIRADVHRANLAHFRASLDSMIATARRSRLNGPWRFGRAAEYAETARAYCDAFKLSARAFPVEEVAELRAAETDPDARDRAAAAAMTREAKRTAAEKRAREIAARKRAKEDADRRAKWLDGDPAAPPPRGGVTLLRTVGNEVQTSQGARVAFDEARAMYRNLVTRPADARAPLVGFKIGPYVVARIESDRIVIGCHTLTFAAVEDWAERENILVPGARLCAGVASRTCPDCDGDGDVAGATVAGAFRCETCDGCGRVAALA